MGMKVDPTRAGDTAGRIDNGGAARFRVVTNADNLVTANGNIGNLIDLLGGVDDTGAPDDQRGGGLGSH